jgi:hypothetical protein
MYIVMRLSTEMGVQIPQIVEERLVTAGLSGLTLERADLALHLFHDV